jgi:hypothetical protein
MMNEQLDWTQKLGDAFLASEAGVMDRIQFLRDKAEEAGNLKSNDRQKVTTRRSGGTEYIYIEPADSEIVYVPVYEPAVYGDWWYPDYPPYYWPADGAYDDYYYWGGGVTIFPPLWGWWAPRWGGHYIHVNVDRYNKFNHRRRISSNRWRHDPRHRRGVRHDNDGKQDVREGQRRRFDYRGRDGKQVLKPGKDRRRDAGRVRVRDRKDGDRPRASKRSGPNRASAGSGKRKSAGANKRRPNRASSKSTKRSSARGHSKRRSAGSYSRKRSSASRHSSRGRSGVRARRGGGHRAAVRRGGGHTARGGGGHRASARGGGGHRASVGGGGRRGGGGGGGGGRRR